MHQNPKTGIWCSSVVWDIEVSYVWRKYRDCSIWTLSKPVSCLQRKQSNWHCGKLHIFAIKISGEEHLWDFVVIVTANHQLIWWWKLVWPGHWQWSSAELWQWSPEQIFKSLHLSILLACLGHSHLQHNLQMVIITNYHQWIPYYPKPESPFSPSPPPPLNQQEFTPSPKCPPNTQWGGLSPTPRAKSSSQLANNHHVTSTSACPGLTQRASTLPRDKETPTRWFSLAGADNLCRSTETTCCWIGR